MVLFAETSWQDVVLELVKTLAMIATGIFAFLAANRAGAAKTEAGEAKVAAGTAADAAGAAAETATTAAKMSKTAAVHAAESSKRADAQTRTLKTIEQQTNGNLEVMRSELADLRIRYEALLAATPPEPIVPLAKKVDHVVEVVDQIVEASKSGTIRIGPRRDPTARERAGEPDHRPPTDDPKE